MVTCDKAPEETVNYAHIDFRCGCPSMSMLIVTFVVLGSSPWEYKRSLGRALGQKASWVLLVKISKNRVSYQKLAEFSLPEISKHS